MENLKMFTELIPDWENNSLTIENGEYKLAYGADALKIWVQKALLPENNRFSYEAYSKNYGHELKNLLGKPMSDNLVTLICQNVKDCLCANPYILNVSLIDFEKNRDHLILRLSIDTVYDTIELKEVYEI